MAWAKQGSRPIVVDGHTLRWAVRRRGVPGCPCCDRGQLLVGVEDRKGASLHLGLARRGLRGGEHAITPALVAAVVRAALAEGWSPGAGPTDTLVRSAAGERLLGEWYEHLGAHDG